MRSSAKSPFSDFVFDLTSEDPDFKIEIRISQSNVHLGFRPFSIAHDLKRYPQIKAQLTLLKVEINFIFNFKIRPNAIVKTSESADRRKHVLFTSLNSSFKPYLNLNFFLNTNEGRRKTSRKGRLFLLFPRHL